MHIEKNRKKSVFAKYPVFALRGQKVTDMLQLLRVFYAFPYNQPPYSAAPCLNFFFKIILSLLAKYCTFPVMILYVDQILLIMAIIII